MKQWTIKCLQGNLRLRGIKISEIHFFETERNSLEDEEFTKKIKEFYPEKFNPSQKMAMKLHFGERKSDTHLDPTLIENMYEVFEPEFKEVVMTDCTVVYNSDRALASTHKEVAEDNGFDFAPILIADGEKGENVMSVEIRETHFDKVKLGKGIEDYDVIFPISHFTGHPVTGIGAALKNIGMGLGSKEGKLEMHEAFELEVDEEECNACATCVENCPSGAISLQEESASIDLDECLGCGECVAVCPEGAIEIPVEEAHPIRLQERIVEYASGVMKGWEALFINVLFDITELCDCLNIKQDPIVEDIGILVSEDPVSIDQASLDLVGEDKFEGSVDPNVQLKYAEELGLGERDYELVKV